MKKYQKLIFVAATIHMLMHATYAIGQNHQLNTNGWIITADLEKSVLTIDYENLGVVLNNVQLLVKQGDECQKLSNWQVTKEDQRILIHTENPATDWMFYIRNRVLGMTTSVSTGMVTAAASADKNRFPVRMIDYSGNATPVAWKGTSENEFKHGSNKTKNLSFLPAVNPDVLYLSLGQVTSRNMHCLFDRNKNIIIKFQNRTKMLRGDEDNLLQISIPVGTAMIPKGGSSEMIVMYSDYYTEHCYEAV